MGVKSALFNGPIKEEVYVKQPSGFENKEYPNHVYKLQKTLYGLKQAPRAWYECLRDFLMDNSFRIVKANSILFTRKVDKDLWANSFLAIKKVRLLFWPSKISMFPFGHPCKFSFLIGHSSSFDELTVLKRYRKDQFIPGCKFTYY
jgi:hypothetical protein